MANGDKPYRNIHLVPHAPITLADIQAAEVRVDYPTPNAPRLYINLFAGTEKCRLRFLFENDDALLLLGDRITQAIASPSPVIPHTVSRHVPTMTPAPFTPRSAPLYRRAAIDHATIPPNSTKEDPS